MTTLLSMLNKHIFSGVPSNAAWDLIKLAWEKVTEKSWEELYLEAFQSAVSTMRPRLARYADGDIGLDQRALHRALHQDLFAAIDIMSVSELNAEQFTDKLAVALCTRQVLMISGHHLSEADYSQLTRNMVKHATSLFKQSVLENEPAFRKAMFAEAMDNQTLVREVQTYLTVNFDLVLDKLATIEVDVKQILKQVETSEAAFDGEKDYGAVGKSWQTYLVNLGKANKEWHIPTELRSLITWNIEPVPIDDYVRLKPWFEPSLLSQVKKQARGKDLPSLALSEVLAEQSVLIMGAAGAGKSTCLRYLCHRLAGLAQEEFEQDARVRYAKVPVLIALRNYGPARLEELVSAQLCYHGFSSDPAFLGDVLRSVPFIFLLDGLDEVSSRWRRDFINELILLRERYPEHAIVVTTRKQPEPPIIEGFKVYEIQALDFTAIQAFARCYLGNNYQYAFLSQIEERKLSDFIQVPLLLALCLIIFRSERVAFDSLADIYRKTVELYKNRWESSKRRNHVAEPLDWEILESSMSMLAYQMVANGAGYSVSRQGAVQILKDTVDGFKKSHRWSYKHTVFDLLNQLLAHNFLESFGNEINFWHASFRDFFAALFIANLPWEQVTEHVKSKDWALATAFLDGLLSDSKSVRDILVSLSLSAQTLPEVYWPIEILGLMGNDTTRDIIRAVSEPSYEQVHGLVGQILYERRFPGKEVFYGVFGVMSTVIMGDYDFYHKYFGDWFPDPSSIDFQALNAIYKDAMIALSEGNIEEAERYRKELYYYLESLADLDPWLLSTGVEDIDDFSRRLRRHEFDYTELRTFCRDTFLRSSLPFLRAILSTVSDPEIQREAHLAVQCVK